MVILHAFLALAAGLATIVAAMALLTALVKHLLPAWAATSGPLSAGAAFVNIAGSFAVAAAGGYVTAWASSPAPMQHVLALGIAVLVLAALSALQSRGQRPARFLLALVIAAPLGVLAGGLIWLRVAGILG
jgi:hypothetical protein